MTEMRDQIESPSGLDLNPSPPPTARISKKVGLVAIGVVYWSEYLSCTVCTRANSSRPLRAR